MANAKMRRLRPVIFTMRQMRFVGLFLAVSALACGRVPLDNPTIVGGATGAGGSTGSAGTSGAGPGGSAGAGGASATGASGAADAGSDVGAVADGGRSAIAAPSDGDDVPHVPSHLGVHRVHAVPICERSGVELR